MRKQSFLYGSAILVLSAILTKLIGALFKVPITNLLGGTGMSCFSCAYGLFMPIYAVSTTGLPVAVAKLTAEQSALGNFSEVRDIRRTALKIFTLMGVVCSVGMAAIAYPFCVYTAKLPDAFPAVAVIAPSLMFGCVTAVYRGYYEGMRNMYPTALSQVAEALTKLCAGLWLTMSVFSAAEKNPEKLTAFLMKLGFKGTPEEIIIPAGAAAAVLGVTLSTFVGMIFMILRHKLGGDGISYTQIKNARSSSDDKKIILSLTAVAVPVAIGSLITSLTSLIDLATITRSMEKAISSAPQEFVKYGSSDKLAEFFYGSFNGLAITVFNLVPSVVNMLGKGILPTITEAWTDGDKNKVSKGITEVIGTAALVAVPAGLGIMALSREILMFLFSGRSLEVDAAVASLSALGAGVILLSVTTPIFAVFQAVGRADIPVKLMILGAAVKLAGNLFLVPIAELNITGAGIATSASYFVILAAAIPMLKKITGVQFTIAKPMLTATAAGILCAVTAKFMYFRLENSFGNKLGLVISIGIGSVIYLIFALIIGYFAKSDLISKKIREI